MPNVSTVLSLPLIQPAQAQKHVTHNEALRLLDVAVQLAVKNRTLGAPPAAPVLGDRHIVDSGATGLWAGHDGEIALFGPEGWEFFAPLPGWRAHVLAEGVTVAYTGAVWAAPAAGPLTPTQLGVNTTANTTNRLAVAAPATLLSHEGGGHQLKVNKAATSDTASLLFQSGFSGRAEMGLVGNNDFVIKVSPDGSGFAEALAVDRATGVVSLPQGVASAGFSLRDAADLTKAADFDLSGIASGVTRSFSLPNIAGELAVLQGSQTFSGAKSFSGGLTVSGSLSVTAATTSLGTATAAASYGLGTGATLTGLSKTLNLGTGGASGSTTLINLGPAAAGAGGTLLVNTPTVTFSPKVTAVEMPDAVLSLGRADLLGLSADPVAPPNGAIWHNASSGQIRAQLNGVARAIDAQVDVAFLLPDAGDYVLTTTGAGGGTTTTLAGAAGRIDLFPFIPRADLTVDRLTVNCSTLIASALAKLVVYAADANGRPAGKIAETGDLDLSSTGLKLATVALTLRQGVTYWLGVRHSSTATLTAWALTATPDINGGAAVTTTRKVLRRTLSYATAAPANWGFVSSEITAASATAIWLRLG